MRVKYGNTLTLLKMKTDKLLLERIEMAFQTQNRKRQMILVGEALERILRNQTDDEVGAEDTRYHNGTGFSGVDGKIGTSMAKFYVRRKFLTPKQVAYWMKPMKNGNPRILKYRKQLLEFAKKKMETA